MRWLSRLLVALIICFIVTALPALPTQAACVPYGIELSPKSGPPGTEVTVHGHNFDKDTLVDIYYDGTKVVTDRTDSSGGFTLLFIVPDSCTGPYKVEADLGQNALGQKIRVYKYFTVRPGLTVSPEKGPVDTTVTVKGQGFAQNEAGIELIYYLDGSYKTIAGNISANVTGSWERTFSIPSSTRGEHKIDAQGAVSRIYEVKEVIFRVTAGLSTDKSSGSAGESITVTGSRFASNERGIQILLAGQALVTDINANSEGEWEESFKVPEMPAGTYNVTAQGDYTKQEDLGEFNFEIRPSIELSPDEGHVGMDLTVNGRGFAANNNVVIMYNGGQEKTAATNDKGSFEISFVVPESEHGARPVTATDTAENEATATFVMESDPPPTPRLISPRDGGRAGILNKVTPTFEWSAVSDDSGVHYRLQIATSANVTATGEFVDPIVSVSDIAGTSYTLNATEALSCGTYYWIVQAVDKAGNAGDWTAASSFRAGLIPRWGLIVIIVAIVLLLGALIRALVVKRRYNY
jgi:hypothetical protein